MDQEKENDSYEESTSQDQSRNTVTRQRIKKNYKAIHEETKTKSSTDEDCKACRSNILKLAKTKAKTKRSQYKK